MVSENNKEAIKCQVDFMEKEIIYFKGKKRQEAKKAYYRLLRLCSDSRSNDEPIFLNRSEWPYGLL